MRTTTANTGNDRRGMPWFFSYLGWNEWVDSLVPPTTMDPHHDTMQDPTTDEEGILSCTDDSDSDPEDDINDANAISANKDARIAAFTLMSLRSKGNDWKLLDAVVQATYQIFQQGQTLLHPTRIDGTLRRKLMER